MSTAFLNTYRVSPNSNFKLCRSKPRFSEFFVVHSEGVATFAIPVQIDCYAEWGKLKQAATFCPHRYIDKALFLVCPSTLQ